MAGPILTALQNWRERRQAGERPLLDAIRNAFQGQPQTQAPQAAVQQPTRPQPAPAPSQPSAMASYAPMQRPGGPSPSPLASFAPMQRPTAAAAPPSPMASFAPMQRPGSGAVPIPQPNPERMAQTPFGVPGPSQPARMNWGIDIPMGQMPQQPGMLQFAEGMMSGQSPPQFPPVQPPPPAAPTGQTMNGIYQPFIPPGAMPRNIETMTLNQLQELILNGDPNAEELRRATERIQELRAGILQTLPQGVPGGVPFMGPGL